MFKTFSGLILLFSLLIFIQCGSTKPEANPESVEDAQKLIIKKREEQAKNAKKLKEKALKRNFKMQSRPVRKSLKKNAKKLKRRARLIDERQLIGPNYNRF